ncbi:Trk system potassium uptake protein TrkA [bioreactor metagenome]|uniref:Trk system potassium uptake protein TrkA n=1 Tax=bioreactor metagenome TaxID=1076179 RepID=A0A645ACB9_9ZZZZ|nr:TrkA family potassium uptake protein [Erysipelotrichaceae bacterium]
MKVIIIGGGQVGAYIADLLLKNHCAVKIVDNRENIIEKLKSDLPKDTVVYGNGTDPAVLEACGISQTDVVVAVSGADEVNLVVSTIAKFEFAVPRVIARVNNPKNSWLFTKSQGVDVALNQADLVAHIVVEELDLKNMLTLMKISSSDFSIVQFNVTNESQALNKKIKDLDIPLTAVLISISRGKEIIIPHGETAIMKNDLILAFADNKAQYQLNLLFGK